MTNNEVLLERGKPHGDAVVQFEIAQRLKGVMRNTPNWENLPSYMKEALEMDATKTSRILCGDYNHIDHWTDKAGYAELAEIITKGEYI